MRNLAIALSTAAALAISPALWAQPAEPEAPAEEKAPEDEEAAPEDETKDAEAEPPEPAPMPTAPPTSQPSESQPQDPDSPTSSPTSSPTPSPESPSPVSPVAPVTEEPAAPPRPSPAESAPAAAVEPAADADSAAAVEATAAPSTDDAELSRNRGGLKGGINAGRWIGHGPARSVDFGLALGAFYRHSFSRTLALQVEMYMTDKGSSLRSDLGDVEDEALLYIEAPVLARYDHWVGETTSVYGAGGMALARLLDAKVVDEDDRGSWDIPVVAAGGLELRAGDHDVAFELRFAQGLLKVIDDGRDSKARNMHFSLYSAISL